MSEKKTYKVCDFFCGSGGFSEGFRQAGFDVVFAVDIWTPAVNTYKANKPKTMVLQDDIIRLSELPDEEFHSIIPDTEVIIGSPPCQSFSHSNKSGHADKTLGIKLIEAYLRIIARKKYKKNSILKYWVLENVPSVKEYIKPVYTAKDLGLEGSFELITNETGSGVYNAKYYGAPTNRERYFCGVFPSPEKELNDNQVVTLGDVLDSLGNPLASDDVQIRDINNPTLKMKKSQITDMSYIYELATFEWQTAKRLKQDKGYMGKMSFPENLEKPSRTVMATMSASSREAMILQLADNRYRLPTVREAATMMSFPLDYRFYGNTKATKHKLVGNAVPPKMSFAIAKAMAIESGITIPTKYPRIQHNDSVDFLNLNGVEFEKKEERAKNIKTEFKYHIPYMIINAFRVELTNYHSNFERERFKWNAEIHYSQGKDRAKVYTPQVVDTIFQAKDRININRFILDYFKENKMSFSEFQRTFCMTQKEREEIKKKGPMQLLQCVREFIDINITLDENVECVIKNGLIQLPYKIAVGYYMISEIIRKMKEVK